jgi:hemerythrin-like domain-containing protein
VARGLRAMRLIEELAAEHDLIDQVAGAWLAYLEARRRGGVDPQDGSRFVRFFRHYAGAFHHAREEDTLFAALRDRAHLPTGRGPLWVLGDDHRRMAARLGEIDAALAALDGPPAGGEAGSARGLEAAGAAPRAGEAALGRLITEYVHALWHHIDAENAVLLPESEARLRKHGVGELPSRAMTADEQAAREIGEALVARYPPVADAAVVRGDGCVCCPAFGERCAGVEHEWWNEWEWEEFEDHLPSG